MQIKIPALTASERQKNRWEVEKFVVSELEKIVKGEVIGDQGAKLQAIHHLATWAGIDIV